MEIGLVNAFSVFRRSFAGLLRNVIILLMDRDSFRGLVRDGLFSIHDIVALDKSPLVEVIPRAEPALRSSEAVKRFLLEGVEQLKPGSPPGDTMEWRYYRILAGRYQEGLSMGELERRLALGERQIRRIHSRALTALEDILWERIYPDDIQAAPAGEDDSAAEEGHDFAVTLEPLPLHRVLEETSGLFRPQILARGGDLVMQIPPEMPAVQADRVLLRQVLLHLFTRILQSWAEGEVYLSAKPTPPTVLVEILAQVAPSYIDSQEDQNSSPMLAFGLRRLNACLTSEELDDLDMSSFEKEPSVQLRYRLELAMADQVKVLVVDDHEPAIRIIRRYLTPTGIQVIGLSDPTQIMAQARAVRPQAVLLDVMMPAMDGWEILQKLKSDPETRQIPVIICSVWEQPDLAYSLGANGFIKKPVNAPVLLDELTRLGLLDTSGE
jgi:CheY-like chemotaxis protein